MKITRETRRTFFETCRYGLGTFEMKEVRTFEFDGWYIRGRQTVNGIIWNVYDYPADAPEARNLVPAEILAEFLANKLEKNPIYG